MVPQLRNLLSSKNEGVFSVSNSILDKIKENLINELFNQKLVTDDMKNDFDIKALKRDIELELKPKTSEECCESSITTPIQNVILKPNSIKHNQKRNSIKSEVSEINLINKKRSTPEIEREKLDNSISQKMNCDDINHSDTSDSSYSESNSKKLDVRHKFKILSADRRVKAHAVNISDLNEIFGSYYNYNNDCIQFSEIEGLEKSDFHLDKLVQILHVPHLCSQEVSKQYLRRRICSHLYKLLSIIANRVLNDDEIKKLTLNFEMKAREKDPLMGNQYKMIVSGLFNRIKKLFNYT